jgi:Cdc6-like AAA superfamily ATPase
MGQGATAPDEGGSPTSATIRGREAEFAALQDQVIAVGHAGRNGVLILRGDTGVGKTVLLNSAVDSAPEAVAGEGIPC